MKTKDHLNMLTILYVVNTMMLIGVGAEHMRKMHVPKNLTVNSITIESLNGDRVGSWDGEDGVLTTYGPLRAAVIFPEECGGRVALNSEGIYLFNHLLGNGDELIATQGLGLTNKGLKKLSKDDIKFWRQAYLKR